ncbi:MAG: hypothetical protein V3U32_05375, partial [Anaerolineales bacterium]
LVYDVTEPDSLESLVRWRDEILEAVEQQTFLIVGNKIDLERTQQPRQAQEFADSLQAPYLETSALDGSGVAQLFETLAKLSLPE